MSERFRVVPAVYVALLRPAGDVDEVLVQLRQGTGYMDGHWALGAAGHVEQGESFLQAGVREAAEELGVAIAVADLRPLCAMHRTAPTHDPVDERVDFFVATRAWSGTPQRLEPDKAADLRWCRLDRLDRLGEPVVPHERYVLDRLLAGTLEPIVALGF